MLKTQKKTLVNTDLSFVDKNFAGDLKAYQEKFASKFSELQKTLKTAANDLEYFKWLDFDYLKEVNKESKKLAKQLINQYYSQALIVGMGGSGINSLVLQNSLQEFCPVGASSSAVKVKVQNNLDPSSLKARLLNLDVKGVLNKTLFVLVSKSGNTDEVRRNINTILNYLSSSLGLDTDEVLEDFAKRAVIITEPKKDSKKNFLHSLRDEIKTKTSIEIPFLENHDFIGGRFSLFSPVGMFSAELMGLDSETMLAAAEQTLNDFMQATKIEDSVVARLAVLDIWACREKSATNRYSMVYADSLEAVNKFRAQLKGESLTKNGIDSTIHVAGIGTVNHHSDLELLLKDNNGVVLEQVGFLKPNLDHENKDTGLEVLADLKGQSNHESLIRNHIDPLANYLCEKKQPIIQISLAEQSAASLAYFLMQDMLVTIVQAGLQDEAGSNEKLDLAIRQWEVEKYKKSIK